VIGRTISPIGLSIPSAAGMGMVYKAVDTRLDRVVALKFLSPHLSTDARAKERAGVASAGPFWSGGFCFSVRWL
jgi:hypothetical protein